GDLFFMRDKRHFVCDNALAGVMHLREIAVGIFLAAARQPLCAGLGDAVSVAVAIGGTHDSRQPRGKIFPKNLIIRVAKGCLDCGAEVLRMNTSAVPSLPV